MTDLAAPLPIDEALPALRAALATHTRAVLVAPPGAGKTTRVPLALMDEPWAKGGRLIVLEPRRLAARAAAARMAATLAKRSAGRSACACGSRASSRRAPASRSSPRACSPA